MSISRKSGVFLFGAGIIILLVYGLYQGFKGMETIDVFISLGVGAIILGIILLLISVVVEQRSEDKKMREKIKKEDLEP